MDEVAILAKVAKMAILGCRDGRTEVARRQIQVMKHPFRGSGWLDGDLIMETIYTTPYAIMEVYWLKRVWDGMWGVQMG